jgi:DNA-binding beta-propeller fold protein YncE
MTTRLYSAATAARVSRALVGFGAAILLAAVASGCVGSAAPSPTPDPFAGLADRSDQAFRQGLEAYGQGQYRDALTSFELARTLSPTGDTRIDQMIARSRGALAPTPTPVPATPTEVPAIPTATPVAMSSLTPDGELGRRYFGQVTLAMVPGRDSDAPAATQFFYQDQIGLHIEGLKQRLRLPFTMRVFNTDSGRPVAEVQSEDNATVVPTPVAQGLDLKSSLDAQLAMLTRAGAGNAAAAAGTLANAVASGTPTPQEGRLARFWDTYVWYHKGGEEPGRYRLELYANGILTHNFDYSVGTVPAPLAEPTLAPAIEPTATLPTVQTIDLAPPPVVDTRPTRSGPASAAAPAAPAQPTAMPTAIPTATPVPTPATAGSTTIGGVPAGIDVNPRDGRVFIADGSGVVWTTDPQNPARFNRPVNLGRLPVDLAIDRNTGYVFISARNESSVVVMDGSGRRLSSIAMPVAPGDLQVDSDLGLVYVVLPERQALGVIDGRAGRLLRTIEGLPQVTSLAMDPVRHMLYASHLAGQVTIIDVRSSQVTARLTVTGVGLAGVATSRGLAYAVNTATHELAVIEPVSLTVSRYVLPAEPAAVAASEDSGSVYVLGSRPNTILRIDPTDGTQVGSVILPDRSGRFGVGLVNQGNFQGLRARMVLNSADESLYVTLPEAGSLSMVPTGMFPPLAQSIPWVETPETPVFANIPGVTRPAAPADPDQPAPAVRAQATTPNGESN